MNESYYLQIYSGASVSKGTNFFNVCVLDALAQDLLRWELGDHYSATTANMKIAELQALWDIHKNDEVPNVILPKIPAEPQVSAINNTELGHARQRQFEEMLNASQKYNDQQLQQLTKLVFGLCNERGVDIMGV